MNRGGGCQRGFVASVTDLVEAGGSSPRFESGACSYEQAGLHLRGSAVLNLARWKELISWRSRSAATRSGAVAGLVAMSRRIAVRNEPLGGEQRRALAPHVD